LFGLGLFGTQQVQTLLTPTLQNNIWDRDWRERKHMCFCPCTAYAWE